MCPKKIQCATRLRTVLRRGEQDGGQWGDTWGILVVRSSYGLITLAIMNFDPYCWSYYAVLGVLSGMVDRLGVDGRWSGRFDPGPQMLLLTYRAVRDVLHLLP